MSFAITAAVVAVGSVAYSGYQANMANKQQRSAQNEARLNAEAQAKAADQAMNAANRKSPNVRNILESNTGSGLSGTMLTGPQGVSNDKLQLGKSTLLGM